MGLTIEVTEARINAFEISQVLSSATGIQRSLKTGGTKADNDWTVEFGLGRVMCDFYIPARIFPESLG